MDIIGVDFSGAKSDNRTWVAQGSLDEGGLTLRQCTAVSRARLTDLLLTLPGPAVAALDFPFSVPIDFARYWRPEAQSMPDLWAAAATMKLEEFVALRDAFVVRWGETKRQCDGYPAYSCLHLVNPNMVPMTFRGMQMLARMWSSSFAVPPLESPAGAQTTLLEAMPGATLKALGLPYKGYKNGVKKLQLRGRILDELPVRSSVPVKALSKFQAQCLESHDCLDAVVAAITACLWVRYPAAFPVPAETRSNGVSPRVLMEGWIYAPDCLRTLALSKPRS